MSHIREKQLKDGEVAYMLVVEAGKDIHGKRIQRTRTLKGITKREARKELSKFEQEIREGTYLEKKDVSLKSFLEEWLETFIVPYNSPTTVSGYRQKCNTYIFAEKWGIGQYPVQSLNLMIIQRFVNTLSKRPSRRGGTLSPKTVKSTYNILRSCLDKVVEMDIIKKNPASNISLPKMKKPEIKVFTQEEVQVLLAALEQEKSDLQLPVNLALAMGLRRGEVLGLKFSDVDYEKKTIKIHNNRIQCCDYQVFEKEPKTRNSIRTLNVPDTLLKMIKKEEVSCKKRQMQNGRNYNKEGYVCYKPLTGKPWMPDNLTTKYRRFIKNLGITPVSFHGLRHCFASLCLHEGIEILEISKKLGHATPSFTYDTYTHLMEDKGSYVADTMDKTLYGTKRAG